MSRGAIAHHIRRKACHLPPPPFRRYQEDEADVVQARSYKLRQTSKALDLEIEAFKKRRTAVLCRHRYGRAVQQTTVER